MNTRLSRGYIPVYRRVIFYTILNVTNDDSIYLYYGLKLHQGNTVLLFFNLLLLSRKKGGNIMIGKNLRYLRLKKGLSQEYIAKYLGKKSFTTVQKWESDVTVPSLKDSNALAKLFEISIDDLISIDLKSCENDNQVIYSASSYPFVPEGIAAGFLKNVKSFTALPTIDIPDILLSTYAKSKDIVIMKINGDSMNKIIPNGSYIAVKTNIDVLSVSNGDIVVANVEGADNGCTFKHIYKDDTNNRIILRPNSTNPIHTDIIISSAESQRLYIVGKVVAYNVLL